MSKEVTQPIQIRPATKILAPKMLVLESIKATRKETIGAIYNFVRGNWNHPISQSSFQEHFNRLLSQGLIVARDKILTLSQIGQKALFFDEVNLARLFGFQEGRIEVPMNEQGFVMTQNRIIAPDAAILESIYRGFFTQKGVLNWLKSKGYPLNRHNIKRGLERLEKEVFLEKTRDERRAACELASAKNRVFVAHILDEKIIPENLGGGDVVLGQQEAVETFDLSMSEVQGLF